MFCGHLFCFYSFKYIINNLKKVKMETYYKKQFTDFRFCMFQLHVGIHWAVLLIDGFFRSNRWSHCCLHNFYCLHDCICSLLVFIIGHKHICDFIKLFSSFISTFSLKFPVLGASTAASLSPVLISCPLACNLRWLADGNNLSHFLLFLKMNFIQ